MTAVQSNRITVALIMMVGLALIGCSAAPVPTALPQPPAQTQPTTSSGIPATVTVQPDASSQPITGQKVTFQRGDLTLVGYLFKPEGNGPFPALIWNHGSEQNPDQGQEFPGIARVFVPAGYVVFAPVREGQGESQGEYIADQTKAESQKNGRVAGQNLLVQLMEGPQLDDQLAGEAYLASLPYVDKNRIAVVGCSYGGIQPLLGAEKGVDYKAAVAISPGAESWNDNTPLQQRLLQAVDHINIPVFILHPQKDANTQPGYVLGQEFQKLGKPYQLLIYAPYGTDAQQAHCFGGAGGNSIWSPEVLRFLETYDK